MMINISTVNLGSRIHIYFHFHFQTLIMVLGEYESNDMLEGEYENENKFTLYFTMILLALLAIIGR